MSVYILENLFPQVMPPGLERCCGPHSPAEGSPAPRPYGRPELVTSVPASPSLGPSHPTVRSSVNAQTACMLLVRLY